MSGGAVTLPGWYGKLASLGDFASRRLSPAFIARWDGWLQQVIAGSRARLGDGWLDAYLSCAVWRFLEWPDEGAPHVGVLMPSVDRVGRYFPLCIAAPMGRLPASEFRVQPLLDWLDRLEVLALQTLDTARSAQQFDAALLDLPLPEVVVVPQAAAVEAAVLMAALRHGAGVARQPAGGPLLAATLGELTAAAATDQLRGSSLWWTGGSDAGELPLVACRRLPDVERFTAMLLLHASAGAAAP